MREINKSILIGAASIAWLGLITTDALACKPGHCRIDQVVGNLNARKGCGQLVHLMHPDFKGHHFRRERERCLSDPDHYSNL